MYFSEKFKVSAIKMRTLDVFNPELGRDNKLFVDPKLLERGKEEFKGSHSDLLDYFAKVYFEHPETLQEFRRTLSLCDFISLIPFPLGVSAYAKSGNADFPGFHVRAIGGAIYVVNRWIYFSFLINWDNEAAEDQPTVDAYFSVINYALTTLRDQTLKQSV